MGCFSGLTKYILFLFNFVIVVCAIVLIAFGAIYLVDEGKGIDGFTSFSVGGFAIAIGVIIFIVAFFGCCGAIKRNSCMLTAYAAILLTLFILQLLLGIMGLVAINNDYEFEHDVTDLVKKLFDKYTKNNDDKKIIDDLQQDLECCGVNNPLYWSIQLGPEQVPQSCCTGSDACTINQAYKTGCGKAFTDLITDNITVIAGVAIGFAVVELLGAIFAFIVRKK